MKPTIAEITAAVAARFKVKPSDITGDSRLAQFIRPRFAAYAMAREAGYSYPTIAARIGGRDHASVMHGVKRFNEMCNSCHEYFTQVEAARFSIAAITRQDVGKPITPAEAIRLLVAASERMQRETQSIIAKLEAGA